jgi:hypothetical protein
MQSFHPSRQYSFRVDANALGGFFEEPLQKDIPTLAPVSLPPVGGLATARSAAFNLGEIVSCSSAYTRVIGREHHADGSISISAAAIVEDLNLLEVVTAKRVVAQVSIFIPAGSTELQFSFAGSRFEGLLLAGCEDPPTMNSTLCPPGGAPGGTPDGEPVGHGLPLTWQDIQGAGRSQAEMLIDDFKERGEKDAYQWALKRHGWMTSDPLPVHGGSLLCSLVDGFGEDSNAPCGHIVEIPGFGRIFLGEVRVSRNSVQLVAIRAELGCPVKGKISICSGGGGGTGDH